MGQVGGRYGAGRGREDVGQVGHDASLGGVVRDEDALRVARPVVDDLT